MRIKVYKKLRNIFANALSIVIMATLVVACSDNEVAGGASGDAGIVAIKNREIAGVTQKGPFVIGSSVTIQELDGHTLGQTGNSFKASVKSDQGDFVVKGVNLVSQYALLEVNGYYLNEVSWKKSEGKIALQALTDLSDRSHVNVNILTHLTANRILTLVRKEGKSFADAKKQAEKEVLKSFAIMEDVENSEDLDLFEDENGSVLLAVSVLMQGERSEADFSELLAKATFAFADSGVWHGPEKAEVADWAFLTEKRYLEDDDSNKRNLLREIKENLMALKGVDYFEDTTLEKYIYDFWVNEYGLGKCDENNLGEIRNNKDEYSEFYNVNFKCDGERWLWTGIGNLPDSGALEIIDLRNETTYKTMRFGNVVWMTENLRYAPRNLRYAPRPQKNEYLYNYESAMTVCPVGSRLPRYHEVENLLQQYGGAGKIAADSLMLADGFNALQDGFSSKYIDYDLEEEPVYWGVAIWISTRDLYSWVPFVLWIDSTGAEIKEFSTVSKASVRCVVDSESEDVHEIGNRKQYSADKYITDARDNEKYRFTEINGKYWMAENLRYGAAVSNDSECSDEGCFYSWYEAVGSDAAHDVCPEGWHLPSRFEWDEMLTFVAENRIEDYTLDGMRSGLRGYDVGYRLCDYRDWNLGDYVLRGEKDPYDFSAKPLDVDAEFWTSSDTTGVKWFGENVEGGWMIALIEENAGLKAGLWLEEKQDRHSIRCVKDK